MRIIDWERFIDPSGDGEGPAQWGRGPLALGLGVFDGVHRGHQSLITRIRDYAGSRGALGGLITFRQNPRTLIRPQHYAGDLYSLPQKLRVLEDLGLDFAVLIDFSRDFSRLTGSEFVALLGARRIDYLTVGVNFRCGYRLDTSARDLRDMMRPGGTLTELAPQVRAGGSPISSSRIRDAVLAGDLAGAEGLLGRPYDLDLTGLCPALRGGLVSWDFGNGGRALPPAGRYEGVFKTGGAQFPVEVSIDTSRRLSLPGDSVAGVYDPATARALPGDILTRPALSVEFRARPGGEALRGSQ
jgi:hypothetical protein